MGRPNSKTPKKRHDTYRPTKFPPPHPPPHYTTYYVRWMDTDGYSPKEEEEQEQEREEGEDTAINQSIHPLTTYYLLLTTSLLLYFPTSLLPCTPQSSPYTGILLCLKNFSSQNQLDIIDGINLFSCCSIHRQRLCVVAE